MSQIIKLTNNEAELLYHPTMKNYCPYKYFTSERRVWWTSSPITNINSLSYTICQDCYHDENFSLNNLVIKKNLVPIIIENTECNCDAKTIDESYQVLSADCNIAVYLTSPKFTLPELSVSSSDPLVLNINCLYKKSRFVINVCGIVQKDFANKKIISELDLFDGNKLKTNRLWSISSDGKYSISLDKICSNASLKDIEYKYLTYCGEENNINADEEKIIKCNLKIIMADYNVSNCTLSNPSILKNIDLYFFDMKTFINKNFESDDITITL